MMEDKGRVSSVNKWGPHTCELDIISFTNHDIRKEFIVVGTYIVVIPNGWEIGINQSSCVGIVNKNELSVLISAMVYPDDKVWTHVSCARENKLPTYDELCMVKNIFIGEEHSAIMVFPKESKKVNQNPYCLHLFSCVHSDPLPDFTMGSNTL